MATTVGLFDGIFGSWGRKANALVARAQRAATAGDEEAIATPNSVLSAERATIDIVTAQASSGITAITSTSTSHSGRPSPATTMPVDTGWTPLSQRPTTR